jgi:hypothetical protein
MVANQIQTMAGSACLGRPITRSQQVSATPYATMLATRTRLGAALGAKTRTSPTNEPWARREPRVQRRPARPCRTDAGRTIASAIT